MNQVAQSSSAKQYHLQAWRPLNDAVFIDKSLARGIRRAYFKKLLSHHETFDLRLKKAKQRNQSPFRAIETDKQLRDRIQLTTELLGPLLPVYQTTASSCSKSGAVVLMLRPSPISASFHIDSGAKIEGFAFARPGRLGRCNFPVTITAHVIDRIIQRAGIVDLPLSNSDLAAINAELSDLLPLAILATKVLLNLENTTSREASDLQILIPNQHGVFLGKWSSEEANLVIQTFVDYNKLNTSQSVAASRIKAIGDDFIAPLLMDTILPKWFNVSEEPLQALEQAWREYGWQFSEERLHPGLSDSAWSGH